MQTILCLDHSLDQEGDVHPREESKEKVFSIADYSENVRSFSSVENWLFVH